MPCSTHIPGGAVTTEDERSSPSSVLPREPAVVGRCSSSGGEHQPSREPWRSRAKVASLVVAIAVCILYMVKSYGYGLGSPASLGVGMMPLVSGAVILVGLIAMLVRAVASLEPRRDALEDDEHKATIASLPADRVATAVQLELPRQPASGARPKSWGRGARAPAGDTRRCPWLVVTSIVRLSLPTSGIFEVSSIGGKLLRLLLVLAGALPLLLLSGLLGFIVASAILVIVTMISIGERRVVVLLASAALVPIAEYLLFHTAFSLPLP